MTLPCRARFLLACALAALLAALAPASASAAAAPQLWLPTPPGETWRVLQGFRCGSHVGHQSRSLDLVNAGGRTAGAPVRAAADGTSFVWQRTTGTLILAHGDGFYSMYTHMRKVITTGAGLFVRRGAVIGEVGSVGTDIAHLHFTFFHAPDAGAYRRTTLELDFADGYSFHDTGGCSQHEGETMVAAPNAPDGVPPTVSFREAAPGAWFCEDRRIEFGVSDNVGVGGFSQAFDGPPPDDAPVFRNGASAGFVQLGWAGEGQHTLFVRAWDVSGEQATVSLGPIGLDTTPPRLAPAAEPERVVPAHTALSLSWGAADDGGGSGVAGYKLYLGADPGGTSDWFSDKPSVEAGGLEPGRYVLRAQALDKGCKRSDWVTLQTIIAQ
jgi:hypothetical protein